MIATCSAPSIRSSRKIDAMGREQILNFPLAQEPLRARRRRRHQRQRRQLPRLLPIGRRQSRPHRPSRTTDDVVATRSRKRNVASPRSTVERRQSARNNTAID